MALQLSALSTRVRLILGAVAGVILLVAAFVAGLATGLPSYPGDASAEAGFARDMSAHHAQAVELGMIAYRQAQLPELRQLGGDIALTQQAQIGIMKGWLTDWGLNATGSSPPMSWMPEGQRSLHGNLMPGMASQEEIAKLRKTKGKQFDILFCQYMLRHHLGGIHMVEGLLAQSPSPEVASLAEGMKRNQTAENQVLMNYLNQLGAKPLPE
jgi:uncharacterized protein (DUF305 family)